MPALEVVREEGECTTTSSTATTPTATAVVEGRRGREELHVDQPRLETRRLLAEEETRVGGGREEEVLDLREVEGRQGRSEVGNIEENPEDLEGRKENGGREERGGRMKISVRREKARARQAVEEALASQMAREVEAALATTRSLLTDILFLLFPLLLSLSFLYHASQLTILF